MILDENNNFVFRDFLESETSCILCTIVCVFTVKCHISVNLSRDRCYKLYQKQTILEDM